MTRYDRYLWYVLRHKWYVGVACLKEGLWREAFFHDLSKFLPSEFVPYARHFHGPGRDISYGRTKTGYYKPTQTGDEAFDRAWFNHARRNAHHWQFWCCGEASEDGKGELVPFEMPDRKVREMVCDWIGAGKAQGSTLTTAEWYKANRDKMVLHPLTQFRLEYHLGITNRETLGIDEGTP